MLEIISLLKDIKTNSPAAFQELVNQRIDYQMFKDYSHLLYFVISIVIFLLSIKYAKKLYNSINNFPSSNNDEASFLCMVFFSTIVLGVIAFFAGLANLSCSGESFANATAPLGKALEIISK